MKWFDNTALTIVIIGAVNWLLVGIFRLTWLPSCLAICPGFPGSYMRWSACADFI